MGKAVEPSPIDSAPASHEATHVHAVYERIAPHFSSTRYKPWPIIAAFLAAQPRAALGLDAGTGNGKYLPLAPQLFGLDRSGALLAIARHGGAHEVVRGDVLDAPWRAGVFDYALSIATIHHLASRERRVRAVQRLLEAVAPEYGRVLIYVWATEQDALSKREVPANLGTDTGDGQDVFVPWTRGDGLVERRYYHMFARGELRALVDEAAAALGGGVQVVQEGWERSNHYVELRRCAP